MDMTMAFSAVDVRTTFFRRSDGVAYMKVKSPKGDCFAVNNDTGILCNIPADEIVRVEKIMVHAYNQYHDSNVDFPSENFGTFTDNVRKAASYCRGNGEIVVNVAGLSLYTSEIPRGVSTTDYLRRIIESRGMTTEQFLNHPEVVLENTDNKTDINKVISGIIANSNYQDAKKFIYTKVLADFRPASR